MRFSPANYWNRVRSTRRVSRATAVLLSAGLLAGFMAVGDASAQDVNSLKDKAAQIASQLTKLQDQAGVLDEQYLVTQQQLTDLEAQRTANEAAVADAKARMDTARTQASTYMVEAFMGAGAGSADSLGGTDPNQQVSQKVLLETLQGDRSQVVDDLNAAKSDLAAKSTDLDKSKKELADKKDSQAKIKSDLENSVNQQQNLLSGANAELQTAIQAEQAAQAAAVAAKAAADAQRAAAAEQAAAQAAAVRQASSTTSSSVAGATSTTAAKAAKVAAAPAAKTKRGPAIPAAPVAVSPPNGGGAIGAAQSVLGVPYRWAGATPAGFDCSGLVMWAYAHAGKSLPHSSSGQYSATQRISASQLAPGDLVFFGSPIHHVGLYIGGGQMIHAPHTGDVVRVAPISEMSISGYGRVG